MRARLRAWAGERRRFGYRRLGLLLSREGVVLNHKKLRRLYAEERLQVQRRSGRKRALDTRAPIASPDGPNQRWSLDFVSDSLSDGRRFSMLCVVDDCTGECLAQVICTFKQGRIADLGHEAQQFRASGLNLSDCRHRVLEFDLSGRCRPAPAGPGQTRNERASRPYIAAHLGAYRLLRRLPLGSCRRNRRSAPAAYTRTRLT